MSNDKKIWDFLINAGLSPAGTAGLMGNLYAESGLIPNRVEMLCLKRLKEKGKIYTDATYTAFVDDGTITKEEFLHPLPGKQYGYGLAQWTTPARKAGLYDLCRSKSVSIGDLNTQMEYLLSELKNSFKTVFTTLKKASSIRETSDIVLKKFEAPADTGKEVQETRYAHAVKYYNQFTAQETGVTADDVIGVYRSWLGKNEHDGSHHSIIDLYNGYKPLARGYKVSYKDDWCDTCLSAAFIKLNAVYLIGGTECGVWEHVQIFKKAKIWKGKVKPKKGWIIVFDWQADGVQDHIGIVEKVDGDIVTTIEGNRHDSVERREIVWNDPQIAGYAAPKYASKKQAEETKKEPTNKLSETPKWVGRVTADVLNVRSYAGTEYPNIKSYPYLYKGNLIDVCDEAKAADGKKWYFIRIAGKIFGFVSSAYITVA